MKQSLPFFADNFIIKNRMESGTILHLALLKKLCSVSPKFSYLNKFRTFRTVNSHQSNRDASSSSTPEQPFQKYPKTDRELNFIRTKSNSLDDKDDKVTKYGRRKMQLKESMNLCGWNPENEQEYNYDKYFKRNNHPVSTLDFKTPKRKPRKQSKPIKQKKFTYCQQDINQFFKQIQLTNTNIEKKCGESHKQKKSRLYPLIIDDIKTQSRILNSNKPIYIDKQNLLSEQLQLISCHKMSKLRKKTKVHNANDLVREWNFGINHKRIC